MTQYCIKFTLSGMGEVGTRRQLGSWAAGRASKVGEWKSVG